jgi:hypothetical protein
MIRASSTTRLVEAISNVIAAVKSARSRKCAISPSADAPDDLVVAGAVRCLPRIASRRLLHSIRFGWRGHVIDDAIDATAFAWF